LPARIEARAKNFRPFIKPARGFRSDLSGAQLKRSRMMMSPKMFSMRRIRWDARESDNGAEISLKRINSKT
jgi:hypothetical protein